MLAPSHVHRTRDTITIPARLKVRWCNGPSDSFDFFGRDAIFFDEVLTFLIADAKNARSISINGTLNVKTRWGLSIKARDLAPPTI